MLLFPAMKPEVVRPPGDSAPAAGAAAAAAAPAVAAAAELLANGSAAVRSGPARALLTSSALAAGCLFWVWRLGIASVSMSRRFQALFNLLSQLVNCGSATIASFQCPAYFAQCV